MPGSLMISFREPTLTGIVEKLEITIVKEDGREFLAIESMGVFRALAEVLENLVKNQDDVTPLRIDFLIPDLHVARLLRIDVDCGMGKPWAARHLGE